MLISELLKKEVIDKSGNSVGLVEDAVVSQDNKITHLIISHKGALKVIKSTMTVHIEDIQSISNVVVLNVLKDSLK